MAVFGTQIHLATFIYIMLETCLFFFQLVYYFNKPIEKSRKWYLFLLATMLLYNITGGLFPDPKLNIGTLVQSIISYSMGLLMVTYLPYYFYRILAIKELRRHVFFGVPLFILLPFTFCFLIEFVDRENQVSANDLYLITPLVSMLILLRSRFRFLRNKYSDVQKCRECIGEIIIYGLIGPWISSALLGLIDNNQLLEVLCTNGGIIFTACLLIRKSIMDEKTNLCPLHPLRGRNYINEDYKEAYHYYKLTNREIEIVGLVRQGLTYREIADKLFIAEKTVENHVRHIYDKTNVNNKVALLHKLSVGA